MRLSKKLPAVTVAVLTAVGLVYAVFDNPEETDDRSALRSSDLEISETPVLPSGVAGVDDRLPEHIATLNQEIMVLRQNQKQMLERVEGLVAMFQALDRQQYPAPGGQGNLSGIDDKADNAYYPDDDEIGQARIERYETNLASQYIDNNWGEEVYGKVESMILDQPFSDSSVVSMDCRDTLCKLDMMHVDESAMDSFLGEFPHHMAWNNDSFVKTEEQGDGSIRTMIYFSRDGHTLPGANQVQNDY